MSDVDFGERVRIFFIGTLTAIWLCIIDGVNYSLRWDEHIELKMWPKLCLTVSGYAFCFLTFSGSFLILIWQKPKFASVMIIFSCLSAGIVRFVTVWVGTTIFWQETYLESIISGCTDCVIIIVQIYLLCEVLSVFPRIDTKYNDGYTKIPDARLHPKAVVDIDDEAIFNERNPHNPFNTVSEGTDTKPTNKSEFMKAYS